MNELLEVVNSWGQFEASLAASAVLLVLTVILRWAIKDAVTRSKAAYSLIGRLWLLKFIAHHHIYGSHELPEPLRLFFLVILTGISYAILAACILLFAYGVDAVVAGQWFLAIAHWLAFNCALESYLWARDSRRDKTPRALFEEAHGPVSKLVDEISGRSSDAANMSAPDR